MQHDPEALLDAALARSWAASDRARLLPLLVIEADTVAEAATNVTALCRRVAALGCAGIALPASALGVARAAWPDGRLVARVVAPEGDDDLAAVADAVGAAVAAGADAIDVPAPAGAVVDGDIGLVVELVELCRSVAGPETAIGLSLDTAQLRRPELITAVARSAVMGGIDWLGIRSDGMGTRAALEATAVVMAVANEAAGRVGVEAGSVATPEEALAHLHLAEALLGSSTLRLRAGPQLLDALQA